MRGLQIVPYNTKIDFAGMRYPAYAISLLLICATFISLFMNGLNFGIDFKGGFLLEVRTEGKADLAELRGKLSVLNLGDIKLQEYGSERDVLIRIEKQSGGEKEQSVAIDRIREALGDSVEYRRTETVGAKVSADILENGMYALCFALVGMLIYVWFRFEWQFGLIGIVALMHDCIGVLGFYSLSGFEFNEQAFAAFLTTVGYSINDTVVIYDRLRENLRKYKKTPLREVINMSANDTLSRTILTSGTTAAALFVLYWLGGPVVENFSLPILVGVLIGTFSSIFISVNLLLTFGFTRRKSEDDKNQESEKGEQPL